MSKEISHCGIIGQGFVGSAIKKSFEKKVKVDTYDIKVSSTCRSLEEIVNLCDILFICLPTPMNNNGSCNIDILEQTLFQISSNENLNYINKYFVIKSTVPVGTCLYFQNKFKNLNIIFNPEFLTEANSYEDFKKQNRIILGGEEKNLKVVKNFYRIFFKNIPIILTNFETAELCKYLINTFLAVKVSFANEIFEFCKSTSVNYSDLIRIATHDNRLGNSHWQVPGPDGNRGYGGSCFPKDISSLIYQFEERNIKSYILKASLSRNTNFDRDEQDWLELKGRAVVNQDS